MHTMIQTGSGQIVFQEMPNALRVIARFPGHTTTSGAPCSNARRLMSRLNAHRQTTRAGDRIVTIGRNGSYAPRGYAQYIGKIYVAQPRKRDGVLTWRLESTFASTRYRVSAPFVAEVRAAAQHEGLEFQSGITQNDVCA